MRLIDADEFAKNLVVVAKDLRTLSTKTIGKALDKTPTVDAVPIVRCKDCIYGSVSKETGSGWIDCNVLYRPFKSDSFCMAGKRREEE